MYIVLAVFISAVIGGLLGFFFGMPGAILAIAPAILLGIWGGNMQSSDDYY